MDDMTTAGISTKPIKFLETSPLTPNAALGQTVLRMFLGVLLIMHGINKLQHGIDGIVGMVTSLGLPGFIAYGVYIGEVVAPLLLIVGLHVRLAALVIAFNMVIAVALAHLSQIFLLSKSGGWAIELQAFYFVTALVVAIQARPSVSVLSAVAMPKAAAPSKDQNFQAVRKLAAGEDHSR